MKEDARYLKRADPDHRRNLVRRFELTIPLRRLLRVTHYDTLGVHVVHSDGVPIYALSEMLYIRTKPLTLKAIPIFQLVDIRAL